jgi:hypothetical protein
MDPSGVFIFMTPASDISTDSDFLKSQAAGAFNYLSVDMVFLVITVIIAVCGKMSMKPSVS